MKLVRKAANDGEVPQMCPKPKVPQRRLVGYSKFSNDIRPLFGGRTGARTWDPMIKSHLLHRLKRCTLSGQKRISRKVFEPVTGPAAQFGSGIVTNGCFPQSYS